MRRRDVRETCAFGQKVGPDAVVVHGHAVQFQTVRHKDRTRILVTWVFDRDAIAAAHEHERRKVQAALRPLDDDDLVGVGNDAAKLRDMTRNRLPQRSVSRRNPVVEMRACSREILAFQTLPRAQREPREVRCADAQRAVRGSGRVEPLLDGRELARACGQRSRSCDGTLASLVKRIGHEGACADTRFEISLGDQLLERRYHGIARDAKALGKFAARQQPGTGRKEAALDGAAQAAEKLRAERFPRSSIREQRLEVDWFYHNASVLVQYEEPILS